MTHPPHTSTTRIGLIAGVTALVMVLSLPGMTALAIGEEAHDPAVGTVVLAAPQTLPNGDFSSQSQARPNPDPIDPLAQSGVRLAVTGDVLELADVPEGQPSVFIAPPGGGALAVDEATLPVPVEPGQTVSAVVDVPGEVVTAMDADAKAELAASPGLDDAINGQVIAADSPVGEVLVEAASEQAALVEPTELEIIATPQVQAAPPAPGAHELKFVFMSKSGRGKFWSKAELDALVQRMADYWVPRSRGVITEFNYSYDSAATVTTDMTCNASSWDIFDEGARALGYSSWTDFVLSELDGQPRHLVVISQSEEPATSCRNTYGGVANVGGGLGAGGNMHLILRNPSTYDFNVETFIHEMGHNLSLYHAGVGTCPVGVVDGPFATSGAVCGITEYGDKWNIMGSTGFGGELVDKLNSGLNGKQKEKLRLIDASSGLRTIDSDGTYDIQLQAKSAGGGTGVEAIKIVETASNREYSVEYDPTAGGVTIRRVRITGDTGVSGSGFDTIVLGPNQTTSTSPLVFTAGQLFIANSGLLTVVPTQISNNTASVHIVRGTQTLPSLSLSANTWLAGATGQTTNVTVTTNQPTWRASSNASWLTVSPTSGPNGATLTLTATANTQAAGRETTVTVSVDGAIKTIDVAQPGVSTPPCWSIQTACAWNLDAMPTIAGTTSSGATKHFYQFTAPRDGTYTFRFHNMNFGFYALAELYDSTRTRILSTVSGASGEDFQITPDLKAGNTYYIAIGCLSIYETGAYQVTATVPAASPALSLSQTTWQPVATGESLPVVVSTNQPTWSAQSDVNWLTVTPASGANGARMTVAASANASTNPRNGTITVTAGALTETLKVTQAGAAATVSLSRGDWAPSAGGESIPVVVSTNYGSWSAVSDQDWLTVNPASGVNGQSLTVSVTANTAANPRTGIITVTAGTATTKLTVTQSGAGAWVRPVLSSWEPTRDAQETRIAVNTNQSLWQAWSDASWVSVYPNSGADGASLGLRVYENPDEKPRTATVRIQAGLATETVTVTQAGGTFVKLWSNSCSVLDGASGGVCSANIQTNAAAGWVVEPGYPDWIVPAPTRHRTGYSTLNLTVLPNPSLEQRVGVIRIGAAGAEPVEYTITEYGVPPRVSLAETFWGPAAAAQSTSVAVGTTYPSWSAVSDQSWLTVSPSSGGDGSVMTVSVAENTAETWRTGTVTVSVTDRSWVRETFTVTQAGRSGQTLTLTASPSSLTFDARVDGKEQILTVTTNASAGWAMSSFFWSFLDGDMSEGPAGTTSLRLKVREPNLSVVPRTETMVFKAPGTRPVTVRVRQEGGAPEVDIPDSRFSYCLRDHVRELTGYDYLSAEALGLIENLNCSGWWSIKSVEGIEYLTNVKSIDLSHSFLSDLGPLERASLPKLVSLDVSSSPISRFPELSGLSALKDVRIAYTGIQSIGIGSPVQSVRQLEMSCSDSQRETTGMLSDLRGLAGRFPNLERFTANACSVSDVAPLAPLKQTQFIMPFNLIYDLSPLRGNPGLRESTFTAQYVTLPSATVGQPFLFAAVSEDGQRLPITFPQDTSSSYDLAAGTITHQAPVVARGYFYSSNGLFSGNIFQTATPGNGLVIDRQTVTVTAAAQSITPPVTVTTTASTGWAISPGYPTWLTPTQTTGPTGQSQVSFTLAANPSTLTRTGQVTFTAAGAMPVTFTVTQAGIGATALTVSPTAITFEAIAEDLSQEVNVSTNAAGGWTVEYEQPTDPWLWIDQNSGSAWITPDANLSVLPRSAQLTFTASGAAPVTVTVTQKGTPEVAIPDPNFRSCLRAHTQYEYISVDELARIESLHCGNYDNRPIRSIVGIGFLTNLQQLDLNNNLITDLEPLKQANLKGLETLSLTANPLTQFPELSSLTKLTQIHLAYTPIKTIGVGDPVPSVTELSMDCGGEEEAGMGQLNNLAGLAGRFPNLESFSAGNCEISDVAPLAPLKHTNFSMWRNHISDLSPLVGNPGLENSYFYGQTINLPSATVGQSYRFVAIDGDGNRLPISYSDEDDWSYDLNTGLITYHVPMTASMSFDGYYLSGQIHQNVLETPGEPTTVSLSRGEWVPSAGVGSIPVTVNTNYGSWSAVSDQGWLAVTPASGTNGQSLTASVTANTSANPRTGTITVTAGTATTKLTVTQSGAVVAPEVTVSASLATVAATGGSNAASTTVATSVPTGWRLRPGLPAWLTASILAGPQGETAVSFSAAANTARTARVFEVGFEADGATTAWFKIAQSGTGTASLALSRTTYRAANSGAETTTTVTTNQAAWTAISSQTWLTVSPEVGVTGEVITAQATPNPTGSSRSATVTVRAGTLSRTLTVTQAAGTLTVSPASTYSAPVAGGTRSVSVTTSQPTGWAVSSNAGWVTVTPTTGTTGQSFAIQAAGNDGPARTATVTVIAAGLSRTISVTQVAATLTVSPSSTYAAPVAGGTRSVRVTTSVPSGWSVSSNANWVTVTPTAGTTGQSFTIQAAGNDGPARAATITVTAASLSRTISVTQATARLTVQVSSYAAAAAGSSRTVTVSTSVTSGWTVDSNQPWAVVSQTGSPFTLFVQPNPTTQARTATVTVTAGQLVREIAVTQPGTAWVSPALTTWATGFGAGQAMIAVLTNQPAWTASSNASWATVTPASGQAGQLLTLSVTANSGSRRTATITVRAGTVSRTISITQAGSGYINLTATQLLAPSSGASTPVQVTSRSTWTATSSDASWLAISPASGATGGTLNVTAQPNTTGQPRYGMVTVTSSSQSATILVTQI